MHFSLLLLFNRVDRVAFSLIALTLSSAVFSACAFKKSEPAPPTTAESVVDKLQKEKSREAADGVLTKDNVSIEFVENPMPNSYQMIVRWPPSIRNITFRVNDGSTQIKNNIHFAEFAVLGGERQKIEMVSYGTVSAVPLSAIILDTQSPIDFVVDNIVELEKDRQIKGNRLFLRSPGRIQTNGFNLTIDVNKLMVDEDERVKRGDIAFTSLAQILTFVPGTVAKTDRDRIGSVISINAREAHGDLRVAMVGVNGRMGVSGAVREKTMPDAPKRIAAAPRPEAQGTPGSQSPDSPGGPARGGYDNARPPTQGVCINQPGNGGPGLGGDRGVRGGPGERGGNAGTLILNVENSKNFLVEVRQKAGSGGKGGVGGPGFPGGLGGLPGKPRDKCNPAEAGPQGPTGLEGLSGADADNGDGVSIPSGTIPVKLVEL
jgi:hypothetical protein